MPSQFKSHRMGLFLLLAPGVSLCAVALLVDLARGRSFTGDWGTGQSAMLLVGILSLVSAALIHRKAMVDERNDRRRYGRTLAFIGVPLLLLVGGPLLIAEAVARKLPAADDPSTTYRQRDPQLGFSIAPNRRYRVISRAKDFDVRVRIDQHGFRRGPGDETISLASADVVVVGDSHPFGFGVPEDQTLSAHLSELLRGAGLPAKTLNAGVPGFGLGQTLLRIQSFKNELRTGAVIVVFVNPMNDLVNLSSAVDYHYPKPHAIVESGKLVFQDAPSDWGAGAFLFSKPFDSLNNHFGLGDRQKWYHSALYRRVSIAAVEPETVDGWTMLVDHTSPEQYRIDDAKRISSDPLLYASRFWPEMPTFEDERQRLATLTGAVFAEMQRSAAQSHWHLVVVVAEEAYQHQQYSKNFFDQVEAAYAGSPIELGWSRRTVMAALQKSSITTVTPDFSGRDPELLFVKNDDHTSGEGHRLIAEQVAATIEDLNWLDSDSRAQQ